MSIGGKKPDPIALRLLKNDKAHAHRYANREEPEGSLDRPIAPITLCEQEKIYFYEFVAKIEEMYPASATDTDFIAIYASAKAQADHLTMVLKEKGHTVEVPIVNQQKEIIGYKVAARPEVKMLNECRRTMLDIGQQFGMSASARCRINTKALKPATTKKEDNPFAKLG